MLLFQSKQDLINSENKRARKCFKEYSERSQVDHTNELVDELNSFRHNKFHNLTTNQLLDYLLIRNNRQTNKSVAKIGVELFYGQFVTKNVELLDAIAFKHAMVLSKGQVRMTRKFLLENGIVFPTTNELLNARK